MSDRRFKLVACDIDGTLLDSRGQIVKENLEAIKQLDRQGIGFTLVTGRMDRMTRIYVRELSVHLPIIACNGAVIRDCSTDELLDKIPIGEPDVLILTRWLEQNACDYMWYTEDVIFYPPDSNRIEYFRAFNEQIEAAGDRPIPLQSIDDTVRSSCAKKVIKILAVLPDAEHIANIRRIIMEQTHCSGALSSETGMDIMKAGVSKGSALGRLSGILSINMEDILAIGDHDNDVSMLQEAGFSIAMANGSEAAKAAASVLTTDNNEAGVARALWDYVLAP
jgi:Cof subfamily protein (haloacid dehalogenase superfamily)